MTDLENKIEALIDSSTVLDVLQAIQTVIYEKASHIESNWQDTSTAKCWELAGNSLNKVLDYPRIRAI